METRNERIMPMPIEQEMKTSFMDYSMSVIVSRALPDVRDGLKPVHRRILYVMHEAGLRHNVAFRKCATIVGDALGKYHPHGDASVYDALVRMAQEWNLRYMLVSGQGNFGSVDGDSAAAYRYTEARMAAISAEMLADIEKETVEMRDNFDGRLQEPSVLPSAIPNLLVNGSYGIAVGMATSCPPHNMNEVCDAIVHMIDNPDATSDHLMRFVRGPDFPTGGVICGTEGLAEAYRTGRGRITVRARASVEDDRGDLLGRFSRCLRVDVAAELIIIFGKDDCRRRVVKTVVDGKPRSKTSRLRFHQRLTRRNRSGKILRAQRQAIADAQHLQWSLSALDGSSQPPDPGAIPMPSKQPLGFEAGLPDA